MRSICRISVYVVLVCLLLSLANGTRRVLHRASADDRVGRQPDRSRVRLRRFGGDNPIHHPVRPSKNALLPLNKDDDCDRPRLHSRNAYDRLLALAQDRANRCSPPFDSRPLPTPLPRHQTLCILLI